MAVEWWEYSGGVYVGRVLTDARRMARIREHLHSIPQSNPRFVNAGELVLLGDMTGLQGGVSRNARLSHLADELGNQMGIRGGLYEPGQLDSRHVSRALNRLLHTQLHPG